MNAINVSLRVFCLLLGALILTSCAITKTSDVSEYRYFAEYGGYFPITENESNEKSVHADWVIPVKNPEGELNFEPPSSAEKAYERVKDREVRERWTDVARTALAPVALVFWMPGVVGITEYYGHVYPEKLEKEKRKKLEAFAGIQVDILITDEQGRPVPGAFVHESVYPVEYPIYTDKLEKRSFSPPKVLSYYPAPEWLESKVQNVPILLSEERSIRRGHYSTTFGRKSYIFDTTSDKSGHARYTSLGFSRYTKYLDDDGWKWVRQTKPLDFNFIVWAPGYSTTTSSVQNVGAGKKISLSITLKALPDKDLQQKAYNEFHEKTRQLLDAISFKTFGGWSADTKSVNKIVSTFDLWIKDESLPPYIRWNASEVLKQVSKEGYIFGEELSGKATSIMEQNYSLIMQLTPCVGEKTNSITAWDVPGLISGWLSSLPRSGGIKPHKLKYDYGYKSYQLVVKRDKTILFDPVIEAKNLITEIEAVDPSYPELEILRTALALKEGNQAKALKLSRLLEHHYFFRMYYDNLDVL